MRTAVGNEARRMPRRSVLGSAATLLAAALAGGSGFGCQTWFARAPEPPRVPRFAPRLFRLEQALLVEDLSEHILPATDTPGALAAGVPQFIEEMLAEVYSDAERAAFLAGVDELDEAAQRAFQQPFFRCSAAQQAELVQALLARTRAELALDSERVTFLTSFRELCIHGYCRSQPGATRLLDYQAVPGRYRGCVPLEPGGRAWATW
jgi:gluconate 2-dehydrogenase gamma chain